MCAPAAANDTILDLIGLGFGPANIAIAAALTETWTASNTSACPVKKVLFIEKHEKFRWHPGMLLPDARMQISFMKDLATLRNPQSPYTFLSYLHSQNRLIAFINRGSTVPTRKEYADYLGWAAQRVQENGVDVMYSHEVVGLNEGRDNTIEVHVRTVATGEERIFRARDIVISPGGSAKIPQVVSPHIKHTNVVHSSAYCTSIGAILDSLIGTPRPLRIAVIGSGQSAAEVTLDLRQRLSAIPTSDRRHEVDMIIRKGSLKPSDDSPFANEIFDPAATDAWFSMSSKRTREATLAEYKTTNYGVVNPRTLEVLYEVVYDQKLNIAIAQRTGHAQAALEPIINILPYTSIASVDLTHSTITNAASASDLLFSADRPQSATHESFLITSQHIISRDVREQKYDAIVCATGYQRLYWVDLLKNSGIGRYFGLNPSSSSVQLAPSAEHLLDFTPRHLDVSPPDTPSPATSSVDSSPLTTPESSMFGSTELECDIPRELYISRNYRLLPVATDKGKESFAPRVYLQGVEEATHGLSDTLLSVLGVRAAEVVADLCDSRR